MAIIYSYPTVEPKLIDKILITQSYNVDDEEPIEGNPTKSVKISSIGQLLGTTGTANTIPMFSTTGLKDSPIYTVPGSGGVVIENELAVQGAITAASFIGNGSGLTNLNNAPSISEWAYYSGTKVGGDLAVVLGNGSGTYVEILDEDTTVKLKATSSVTVSSNKLSITLDGDNVAHFIAPTTGGDSVNLTLPTTAGTIALTSDIPTVSISGSGTTNFVTKWTGANTIGDSLISDNGVDTQVRGNLVLDGESIRSSNFYINGGVFHLNAGGYSNNVMSLGGNFTSSYMIFRTRITQGDGYSVPIGVNSSGRFSIGSDLDVTGDTLAVNGIFTGDLVSGGGVRMADVTDAASSANAGMLKYRISGNNSYVDMCMQTGAATYAWINIKQNNW